MNIFWSGRDGLSPPLDAQFHICPFFSKTPMSFPKITRVDLLPDPEVVKVRRRRFLPDANGWMKAVKYALSQNIEKIVLARCQVLDLEKQPNPFALTAALQKKNLGAHLFCYSDGDISFLGASPEKLFRRKKNTFYSEAMAGTAPRGHTDEEDLRLGQKLLVDEKSFRELVPVQQFLADAMNPLCQIPLSFTPVSLHRTHNVQHLYTQCVGTLRDTTTDANILDRIHPTPALCGTPTREAFDLIQELEPFDRGFYGGALGWSTLDASDWIVGIRSCFIQGRTAYLYAGAGIVKGSDPYAEWEELNQKIKLYETIFL